MTKLLPYFISLLIYQRQAVCWSISSLVGKETTEADSESESSSKDGPTMSSQNRPLSSFQQTYSHFVPINQPVISRGRRDIEASVTAHNWPSTIFSPLCEAWAYLEAGTHVGKSQTNTRQDDHIDPTAWRYLDALVEKGGISSLDAWVMNSDLSGENHWTYQNSTKLALESASDARRINETTIDENLLPLALALRAHSPHCEMHRSLARDAAITFGTYDRSTKNRNAPAVICLLSIVGNTWDGENKTVILSTKVLPHATLLSATLKALKTMDITFADQKLSNLLMPLPDETFHPDVAMTEDTNQAVAVLYGQVGTTEFASFYTTLKNANIKFVVRHMGYISFEEEIRTNTEANFDSLPLRAFPTALQGYGVRLDIRNVEYKAFDDESNEKTKDGVFEQDWNDSGHHPDEPARNEYLAGVNLNKIMKRFGFEDLAPLATDLISLQTALIQSHPAQLSSESMIPPAWKRRSLSLQAASVIASSPDPLEALKGISQNLPSVAHSLSNIHVFESLEKLVEEMLSATAKSNLGMADAAFGFYVNSRSITVERPSFNIFQLLDVLREEDKKLKDLEGKLSPVLAKTTLALGCTENICGWDSLRVIRKIMDMGVERLMEMGKDGSFGDEESKAKENDEEKEEGAVDEWDNSSTNSKNSYRIDVGRGGNKAIIYLNNIEKDREYESWPPSIEQMLFRAQFGGAPTVRRNLFTMLIVIDLASGNHHPALHVAAQLINGQFPLRLGLLVVDRDDVARGSISPNTPWNSLERTFHSRDAFLLLKYISKKYGGMAGLSCLFEVSPRATDKMPNVRDYINSHVSFLQQMGLVSRHQERDVQREMELLLSSSSTDDSYDAAVEYATKKMIRPGMSFLNGIPFPDASDNSFAKKVNEILQTEQRHIMKLAMKGEITDTKPKSIYASLLTGDNLFDKYHPLLLGNEVEYSSISLNSNELSLIVSPESIPADIHDVDVIFVVEAALDLDSPASVDAALNFLHLINSPPDSWHSSKNVSLAFRIVPSGKPNSPVGRVLSKLFCAASFFNTTEIEEVVSSLRDGAIDTVDDAITIIANVPNLGGNERLKLFDVVKEDSSCPKAAIADAQTKLNYYTANGRIYTPIGRPSISIDDIKMLINLEVDRNYAMTQLILPTLFPKSNKHYDYKDRTKTLITHHAIGIAASVLSEIFSSLPSASRNPIAAIEKIFKSHEFSEKRNPLFFSWNEDSHTNNLQVEVFVILDPLTESTQRVAPLLLTIRDFLKLPLKLMLAPRLVVDNDLPLSSYYRFMIDPQAVPDTNPPVALFSNLPSNHLLTLRMDVPEPWDVQQAYAIQDADNLRCDARYGCGDLAYILANKGGREANEIPRATEIGVELTRMEYSLKHLLFFGQCYDMTTNSPPNGLQLTLDKSQLQMPLNNYSSSEMLVLADGSISEAKTSGVSVKETSSQEHTDTLVMRTVGYWQLRAKPGVWNLRIAESSRGSEIYHMVEGTISPSGRLIVRKNATESYSKTLVMKSFSNHAQTLIVRRNKGFEMAQLFSDEAERVLDSSVGTNEVVHIFSLATGHAYERLLKIMMLSVTKRTKSPVKFWLFENFLSPSFKESALFMAEHIGCEVAFVTYKWPEWLRGQSEKQRLIWGYKILFLDVLFPLDVKKIIYVDADQVVRGDMTELWKLDLDGAPYGYTPFCDSRKETLGYQFWRSGFWKNHLHGKPYHISALYVVDLERFRRELVGDKLRATYQTLSADPNSLANLDQDLPNYAQHDVRIFSLPQKWLWCETWCSDETKAEAMTIDLCNNPEHKEAKITMAKRIISGDLFEESWEELDAEVDRYYQAFLSKNATAINVV